MKILNINNLSNKNLNFKRSWQEHKSWGVNIEDGSQSAKIFTFLDAKNVVLEVNRGKNDERIFPLEKKNDGIFEAKLPKDYLKEGDEYQFLIERENGEIQRVKDPYSKKQSSLLGPSVVYNHSAFKWSDFAWKNNPNRISRKADSKNGLTPLDCAKIYELNTATLTNKANFEGVKQELSRIKNLGFNAIEIMPVENTYSYNWGYDGVDKFAPSNFLGGADMLKDLINSAHNIGLNVIMDMVPNHIGVDGSQLQKTGPYSGGSTPWGDAFNYEGENSKYVRDYIVNAALNWIHNYHCDGLRLDMTKFMNSDTTMQQIAAEVNYHFPEAFLIAEDSRSNISVRGDEHWHDWWQPHDQRVTIPLKPNEIGLNESEEIHNQKIDNISHGGVTLSRLGFDSEWDFHFYHTLTKVAYGEADLDALERAIFDSSSRVKYTTSHDETGNMDGTRLVAKYMVPMLKLNENIFLDDKDVQRARDYASLKGDGFSFESALNIVKSQKAQQNAMKLAQMVQNGRIERIMASRRPNEIFANSVLEPMGISKASFISPRKVLNAFSEATRIYRAIEALKYFTPGPVMTFQGEENLDMTKFNFFREFDSIKDEKYLYVEKGYPHGLNAYLDSIMGNQKYSINGKKRMEEFQNLIIDLNSFKKNNSASTVGQINLSNTVKHPQNPTIAMHSKDIASGSETFIISNFSNVDYPVYNIEFPVGKWEEVINTNNEKYGGSGTCQNKEIVLGFGKVDNKKVKSQIALPAKSSVIFKKV
ncbi:MAG: alpha amylase C-terminal domain-containing protein [Candidatus Gastranaerophilales bacterium]|nr:alpha amylase C-terminal domain-containing protein [Candidatus Gastranaerophilales bacterium]